MTSVGKYICVAGFNENCGSLDDSYNIPAKFDICTNKPNRKTFFTYTETNNKKSNDNIYNNNTN